MKNRIVIGTRSSELALWQANFVKSELGKFFPELNIELRHIKTTGDKIQDLALDKIGDKGLFTKQIEKALINGDIDIAVHSLKDLETAQPDGIRISAVTERHAPDDVIIARENGITIDTLPKAAKVASGSLRRRAQLLYHRPDIILQPLRGNVPTRIQKFFNSDWDAIILARAGVERLGLEEHISSIIPVDIMIPAVGQGALGIETRENDEVIEMVSKLNHRETEICVKAERAFLRTMDGGCKYPMAAFALIKGNKLIISAMAANEDGTNMRKGTLEGMPEKYEEIGSKLGKEIK